MGKAASLSVGKLLDQAVTTTLTGTTLMLDEVAEDFGIQYSWTATGDKAVTALVMAIEGSLDGTQFVTLATETADATELSNKLGLFFISGMPVIALRVSLTTVTITGSTGTVTLTIRASQY